jgi:pimeloyl-ACP methyl ester carboxylesterase
MTRERAANERSDPDAAKSAAHELLKTPGRWSLATVGGVIALAAVLAAAIGAGVVGDGDWAYVAAVVVVAAASPFAVRRFTGERKEARDQALLAHLVQKYAGDRSRFVEVDGAKVHYRDEGSGPALVLLHGICASLHTWDGWAARLSERFRVNRMDFPGFGLTGPARINGIDESVSFLGRYLDAVGIERCSLAGNSLGGYISWRYALAHPEKVDRLILLDPVGYTQPLPWPVTLAAHPLVRPFARRTVSRFMIERCLDQVYGDRSRITPELRERYYELALRPGNSKACVDVFTLMRRLCRWPGLSQGIVDLALPTLVMWGALDHWIPIGQMEKWRRDLPRAAFIEYDGVGHAPMEELPDRTAVDALRFLLASVTPLDSRPVLR